MRRCHLWPLKSLAAAQCQSSFPESDSHHLDGGFFHFCICPHENCFGFQIPPRVCSSIDHSFIEKFMKLLCVQVLPPNTFQKDQQTCDQYAGMLAFAQVKLEDVSVISEHLTD